MDRFLMNNEGYENRSPTLSPNMLENSACTSSRSWGASHASEICTAVSASAMGVHERIVGFGLATGIGTGVAGDRGSRPAVGCGAFVT